MTSTAEGESEARVRHKKFYGKQTVQTNSSCLRGLSGRGVVVGVELPEALCVLSAVHCISPLYESSGG